ncbi:hypothetical protein M2145_001212 [Lachnospiraceae bacterium PF1-21]|uniref:Amino acid-binding protein n=1 Tax=Ohessyouella blattaphilus TaxID=2949333 RepID=A0ABT1EKF9_9FIRM|nr:ACT domain-containing protein [Ohessyouella blattaphilus]MCP1110247.1 amino acid-binding protein [Ohessyouella blattaphilus]MCR8563641.1 amino acid-binding protein [Ohessyouella blattaphilus]
MIKQVSIFVENKPGAMMEITEALSSAQVNIRAIAAFDTPEFGILRLVVDNPKKAKEDLTSKGFVVRIQEVIGVELQDEKGTLNHMLTCLSRANINMNYIYSFVIRQGRAPIMVFQADDEEKAKEVLTREGIKMIKEEEL